MEQGHQNRLLAQGSCMIGTIHYEYVYKSEIWTETTDKEQMVRITMPIVEKLLALLEEINETIQLKTHRGGPMQSGVVIFHGKFLVVTNSFSGDNTEKQISNKEAIILLHFDPVVVDDLISSLRKKFLKE